MNGTGIVTVAGKDIIVMNWFEWLLWKLDRRRALKRCVKYGHIITGPHLCMDGRYRMTCVNCVYRFDVSDVVKAITDVEENGA
jgi:hypothetical protein